MGNSDSRTSSKLRKEAKPAADPSYTWGFTPSKEATKGDIGKDHPVHKIPLEKQEKMRAKGINPVTKAEMDQALKGEGGFWTRVGMTSFRGG